MSPKHDQVKKLIDTLYDKRLSIHSEAVAACFSPKKMEFIAETLSAETSGFGLGRSMFSNSLIKHWDDFLEGDTFKAVIERAKKLDKKKYILSSNKADQKKRIEKSKAGEGGGLSLESLMAKYDVTPPPVQQKPPGFKTNKNTLGVEDAPLVYLLFDKERNKSVMDATELFGRTNEFHNAKNIYSEIWRGLNGLDESKSKDVITNLIEKCDVAKDKLNPLMARMREGGHEISVKNQLMVLRLAQVYFEGKPEGGAKALKSLIDCLKNGSEIPQNFRATINKLKNEEHTERAVWLMTERKVNLNKIKEIKLEGLDSGALKKDVMLRVKQVFSKGLSKLTTSKFDASAKIVPTSEGSKDQGPKTPRN